MGHPCASVQAQHTPAVLANRLLLAHRLGAPCLAYMVCIRPSPAAAAALAAIQARVLRLEPSLLCVPERALHFRRELLPLLRLPGSSRAGNLAHMTLFRYARPLRDPAALLQWLAATKFRLDIHVSELLVIRERIFPSLDYEVLHRLPLAPAGAAR